MITWRTVLLVVVSLGLWPGCKDEKSRAAVPADKAEASAAPASVVMSTEAIRAAGVTTAQVVPSTIVLREDLPGTIEAPRDALAIVNARAAGVIESLAFDIGDRVKAGQRLATIRSIELADAQAAYRRALVSKEYAGTALARSQALRDEGVLSQRRVETDRLEAHEQQLALQGALERVRILGGAPGGERGVITVTAPIAGVIAARGANRGQAVEANSPLYTVVDASRVVVQLRALGGTVVKPGVEVPFTVESLPGRSFTAVVKSSSDLLDTETRRFFIRCSVVNSEGLLKPGMFVTGQFPKRSVSAITVPEGAIQTMSDGPAVFVAREGGRFERRAVVLGPRSDGQVAIDKGLKEGESVVVQGSFWVRTQLQKAELEE